MKTAISIPDKLFQQVNRFAQRQKLSRSEFFAKAAERYLQSQDKEQLLRELNRTAPLMNENMERSVQSASLNAWKDLPW